MSDLAGRVAVVTGASRGIGAATAAALAKAGARVVRVSRTVPRDGLHDGFLDYPCDLTEVRLVAAASSRIIAETGVPVIVVSNAGAFVLKLLHETTQEDFDAQLDINLRAPFAVARALLPAMRAAGRGTFIHVGERRRSLCVPGERGLRRIEVRAARPA